MTPSPFRIGLGYDFHRYSKSGEIVLGGVRIPDCCALIGHSDADVLTHAIMDAILGASGERDIGALFPNTDPKYQGACSLNLAKEVVTRITRKGYEIINIDAVLICDQPNILKWKDKIITSLSSALGIQGAQVNLKGKTNEQERSSGVAAHAVALIRMASSNE